MENIVLSITIGQRDNSETIANFFKDKGVALSLGTFGKGTASKETLDMLGIGSSEKCVIFSVMTMNRSIEVLKDLETSMSLKNVGAGISFTVPISSIDSI